MITALQHYALILTGHIQGVGFRPFVYQLAHRYQLMGWIKNADGTVHIHIQGEEEAIHNFIIDLLEHPPPLAKPHLFSKHLCELTHFTQFEILPSSTTAQKYQLYHAIPPDYSTCNECLQELRTPNDHRYRYPFINCTNCGPRYTLIQRLPYDRANTSMADFPLCDKCLQQYQNPNDRRFHAQPLACPVCGPQLSFNSATHTNLQEESALQASIDAIKQGHIIAVKGIGGYHLMCDATQAIAVQNLRNRKQRPAKPLAILLPDDDQFFTQYLQATALEINALRSNQRPIVLIHARADSDLAPQIAPDLNEIGVMLAYSPLHYLLLDALQRPLVATSANLSGEPVLTENQAVEQHLTHCVNGFLHHNRPIIRPADDSVLRIIAEKARPLRLGRGIAPVELKLPFSLEKPTLAVGAHLKNTIALAFEQRLIISPHIGDLSSARSLDVFQQTIEDFQELYGVQAERILHDAHPNYASTRWAKSSGLACHAVLHHHAHASAVVGEYAIQTGYCDNKPWLIFTFDGVGYGEDGNAWGGEVFYGTPAHWQRVAHLRSFQLVGGDKAGREPYRSAAAILWELEQQIDFKKQFELEETTELLRQAWEKRINCVTSTAAGRLFDAIAALLGPASKVSFEGQAPMQLEALASRASDDERKLAQQHIKNISASLIRQSPHSTHLEIDWASLIQFVMSANLTTACRAYGFHYGLVIALQNLVKQLSFPIFKIGVSGGVFQNRLLTELLLKEFAEFGIEVFIPALLPCNDAGISAGQILSLMKC